jgi:hypothetical protein
MKDEGIKQADLISIADAEVIDQNNDAIEALRQILELEQCRPITYEEAEEVGEMLIGFYETLADGLNLVL